MTVMNRMNSTRHWKILPFTGCLKKVKTKKKLSIPKTDYQESGEFPVIDQGASFVAGWTDSAEAVISDNLPVVIFGDHTRIFKYVDFPFALGADGTQLLYPNDEILDPHFFYYALLNLKVPNKGYNRHYRYLREFSVVCPPLPEQRAIAHVLQTIQEAKFTRQREIELEQERKAALMDHLFSHSTKGEPRKQTEIGEIPESWEVVRLGDYCDKPDYGYTESANDSPVGPKFLRITDIQNDAVNWENVPYCICSEEIKEKYLLKTGDIVIARIGATTGKAYIIDDCPEAIFASYLIRVRTKHNLLPIFLAQYFRTNNYWRQIDQSKGGRLKGGVNIPILSHLVLPLPPLSEQQQISEILQACDTKITALEQETQHLDELFHAMLDELMTGQRSAVPLINTKLSS
ncbi:hypothetical protein C6503_16345 [Candidatus Poribacteria bacterium]|nr:MAG: hypothetical protein C6503_16345 [Candidatus Poribacteria bacterium]